MADKRVIAYVDGFNFYYGLKRAAWRKYYWLDLVSFLSKFLKDYQLLVEVHYFSAVPTDKEKQDRQDLFFSANKLNPRFHLHLGKFLQKKIKCQSCQQSYITYEEKESDVRLATAMISDVVKGKCDTSILVSADSDIIPAIDFIRSFKPEHKIYVYFPPHRVSFDLRQKADRYILLERHPEKFEKSLLPDKIPLVPSGYILQRPPQWR